MRHLSVEATPSRAACGDYSHNCTAQMLERGIVIFNADNPNAAVGAPPEWSMYRRNLVLEIQPTRPNPNWR